MYSSSTIRVSFYRVFTRVILLAGGLALTACQYLPGKSGATPPSQGNAPTASPLAPTGGERTLTLLTHDSFAVSAGVLEAFESANQVKVQVLKSGDAGKLTNQVLLGTTQADVVYGIDNTFISKILQADAFVPLTGLNPNYSSKAGLLDISGSVAAVNFGDVCLNYDIAAMQALQLPIPDSWSALAEPQIARQLVVENPINSSPGLAFLLASIAAKGEDGYLAYWQSLKEGGVKVVEDWNSAYYTEFTRYGGNRALVVSYASSPPAEVIFSDPRPTSAPTASIVADGMCFRQTEYAGVLRTSTQPELARKLVEFLLSETFQRDLPLQMFVFPAIADTPLPQEFLDYAQLANAPAVLNATLIAEKRNEWLQAWEALMLK